MAFAFAGDHCAGGKFCFPTHHRILIYTCRRYRTKCAKKITHRLEQVFIKEKFDNKFNNTDIKFNIMRLNSAMGPILYPFKSFPELENS